MRDPAELGYLAGIIDGEGYIRVAPRQIEIQIVMSDTAILEWCHQRFGGWLGGYETHRPSRRPMRTWKLNRKHGLEQTLREVLPYLVLKRAEARIALEAIEHGHNRPSNNAHRFPAWQAGRKMLVSRAREALLNRKRTHQ